MDKEIEVLAAIDEAAQAIEDAWAIYSGAERLVSARTAIADLIAAAKFAQEVLSDRHFDGDRNDDEAIDADYRLIAALERIEAEFKPA